MSCETYKNTNTIYHKQTGISTKNNAKGSEIVDDVFPAGILSGWLFTAGWRYWKYFDSYAVPPWPFVEGWDGVTEYPEPKPKKVRKEREKRRMRDVWEKLRPAPKPSPLDTQILCPEDTEREDPDMPREG